ncbi:hypothetical protein ACCO45_004953 [Purpureocillium lilacinum]|uniref:Uncharacterized protein n=1 Tax=Purpureocillium lilacinum TaxID=33203 RepID=A0ACC4DU09_PURLI
MIGPRRQFSGVESFDKSRLDTRKAAREPGNSAVASAEVRSNTTDEAGSRKVVPRCATMEMATRAIGPAHVRQRVAF